MRRRLWFYLAVLAVVAGSMTPEAFIVNTRNARWPSFPITYKVNGSNADLTTEEATTIIDEAVAVWAAADSAVSFTNAGTSAIAAPSYDGTNVVHFSSGSNGSLGAMTSWWSSGTTTLQFDITVYDGAYLFLKEADSCTGSKLYLLDTLVHEFGHVLGLTHSTDATATMRGSMAYCTSNMRDLAQDDISGINFLYAPGSPSGSAPTAPSALTVTSSGSHTIAAAWTDNASDESGFALQTSRDNSTWTAASTVGAGITSATLSGLTQDTLYYVRVAAFNTSGYSAYTTAGSATTDVSTAQAITLTASITKKRGQRSASLRWTATIPTAMDVYRNNVKITTTAGTSYLEALSTPGTYTYQVCQQATSTCSGTAPVTY